MTVVTPSVVGTPGAVFTANNVANPSTLSPGVGAAGARYGDLALCFAWSRSITATVATPAGWTLLTGFPVRSATSAGGSLYVFAALWTSALTAPSVVWSGLTTGTSGDASGAVCIVYRGIELNRAAASLVNILDAAVQISDQAGSTTTCTIPAITTATKHGLQIGFALKLLESAGTWTPPTNWGENLDANTSSGTGHFLEISSIVRDAIGSVGSTTAAPSVTTSSRALGVSFSLKCAKPPRSPANFPAGVA